MAEAGRRRAITAATVRGGARGAVAAMAMSGLRQATTALGIVQRTPPESMFLHTAPGLFRRVPVARRQALVEMVHWTYGAAGGMLFGLLPRGIRRQRWVGPAYGFGFWLAFEVGIAPLLGIGERRHGSKEQLGLLADHLLYGVVVAASPWPLAD
ncbi:hypothetical protein [Plantactinospora sonchi]|uniref:DUF1440 domain-containing protein n=1 Tax=Plantactinospora sonchi TaxID=1544735 RepID=A0ABU7S587_9ACTN